MDIVKKKNTEKKTIRKRLLIKNKYPGFGPLVDTIRRPKCTVV